MSVAFSEREFRADLFGANLSWAKMVDVVFEDTDLFGANMYRASLMGADLSRADLYKVHLRLAKYNNATKFPPGFNPNKHGMVLVKK